MILAGGNFAVYYNALQRGIRVLIDDFETRMYWLVIFYWNCYNIKFRWQYNQIFNDPIQIFRDVSFNYVSIQLVVDLL